MRPLLLVPAALGMLIVGSAYSPAVSPEPTARSHAAAHQCFMPDQITNFRSSRNTRLYVRARDRKVFELETTGTCSDLDAANRLVVSSFIGSSRLCIGDTANIAAIGSSGMAGQVQRCRAQVSRVLDAEEINALPRTARP